MNLLTDKVTLVTGATSGIGRSSALRFAQEGALIVAASRRRTKGDELVRQIIGAGGSAEFIETDIGCTESVDTLFAEIMRRYGRLDCAFNNAAIGSDPASLPDTDIDAFDNVMRIDVRGTWLCMWHEMRIMRAQGSGSILNTSSMAGIRGVPYLASYVAAKHAVVGMTKSAALELAELNIRINCLCPGAVASEMALEYWKSFPNGQADMAAKVPMKRVGEPQEIANVAAWLLSSEASYMTGAVVSADGGYGAS